MIPKGNTNRNGAALARYVTTAKEGERVEIGRVRGFETDDLYEALRTVQFVAGLTKARDPFFHAYVRLPPGERITREQWYETADRLGKVNGLQKQPHGITFHIDEKTGDEHMHVVWSRIDIWKLKAVPLRQFANKMMDEARRIEVDFDITRVRSRRDYNELQAPTRAEQEQARRLGVKPKEHEKNRADIRALFLNTNTGQELAALLPENGLRLARGDQRPLVVVDAKGCLYALGKRILGVTAAKVREKFADVDPARLPSIREAVADLQKAHAAARREKALRTSMEAGIDERAFHTYSKEEQARARAKLETAQTRQDTEKEVLTRVNERLRGEGVGTTPGSSATLEVKGRESAAPAYDREAEAVRQATALIDGAAKAAPAIARRQEDRERLAESRTEAAAIVTQPAPAKGATRRLYDPEKAARDLGLTQRSPAAPRAPIYDKEAEAVRQAKALIDGAAKAAPEIAARPDREAAAKREADKRAHFERLEVARKAIAGDAHAFREAQAEQRVAFGRDGGKVIVSTGRYYVALGTEEGQRVLEHMDASRREQHANRNAERRARNEKPEAFVQVQVGELPDIRDAGRMAYRLEKRAALQQRVTDAFDRTVKEGDGGLAFTEALAGRGIDIQTDQGKRLHIVVKGRAERLDQFVIDHEQQKHLRGVMALRTGDGFTFWSRDDRADAAAARRKEWEDRQAAYARQQMVQKTVAQPVTTIVRAAGKTASAAAVPVRVAAGALRATAAVVAGFGRYQEEEQASRAAAAAPRRKEAAPAAPSAAAAATAQLRGQNGTARPDTNTKQLALAYPGAVETVLADRLRQLEEDYRNDNERTSDGGRRRERSR